MKRVLPLLVLAFSVSAAGLYVWKSSQRNAPTPEEKSAPATIPGIPSTAESEGVLTPETTISDEEVRVTLEAMMGSTKVSLMITEEDVRERLKAQRKAGIPNPHYPVQPRVDNLAPSTKNPSRAVTRDDIKKLLESHQEKSEEEVLPPP